MDQILTQQATAMNKSRQRHKGWLNVVTAMSAFVVFCTVYALILPAITMGNEPICGLQEHIHSEACYITQTMEDGLEQQILQCELPEHTHTDTCYPVEETESAQEAVYPCGFSEHTHGENCYDAGGNLNCTVPEHTHTDACNPAKETQPEQEENYLCGVGEHAHSESCYDAEGNLSCTVPEHTHSDACNSQAETEPEAIPLCGTEEHTHSETCYNAEGTQICATPEHTHSDTCYSAEETEPEQEIIYLCGISEHTHSETCYDAEGNLSCTLPEHSHQAECILQIDPLADVETKEQWEAGVNTVVLTGVYTTDVPAVAMTQLGYMESQVNVVLTEDGILQGYSRYGAWHGTPYGDWNALFAAFVLEYADVKDFPIAYETVQWMEVLTQAGCFHTPDAYSPKTGDLIFFGENRVGIITDLTSPGEEYSGELTLIQGDAEGRVETTTLAQNDAAILGYGSIPEESSFLLAYQGEDFTVTVQVPRGINIPQSAVLAVREIPAGTEEYDSYYQQSVEALLMDTGQRSAEALNISFARFFDITILVDGVEAEPEVPLNIQISYLEAPQLAEGDTGKVVHFADDGTEVIPAETDENGFAFTQDGFSVSGTLVAAEQTTTATQVHPYEIDNTGKGLYVLYTQIGNNYYALDGNGNAVLVTVNNGTVILPADNVKNLFWSFNTPEDPAPYVYTGIGNLGTGRHIHPYYNSNQDQGVLTKGAWETALVDVSDYTFRIEGHGASYRYLRFENAYSAAVQTANKDSGSVFYVASVGEYYNVWFDGTDGGLMSYYGAADTNIPVLGTGGTATVELPEVWQSSPKYDYTLRGWYDVGSHTYYPVDPNDDVTPTAVITGDTVFYADWVASTYDVGQDNANAVNSLDTNEFITTYVFDYNVLFNVMSQTHTGTISATEHKETWTIVNNGTVPYQNGASLGFSFVDYDANGEFSYPNGRNNNQGNDFNTNQGDKITAGILQTVQNRSGQDLLDLLFNPDTDVIGKYYAGEGNYLFQYMDSTTDNYDGIHDGYYYLDARKNAASYNQSQGRFYVYDYLERTSDSRKDGGVGEYSDFLPFNSPYIFREDQVDAYVDRTMTPGYEYDAKEGGGNHPEYNDLDDANTNYFFGIRTDIEFFLPNDSGKTDVYGNYGNISTRGQHMIFDFHGDDDVWVFVDGELVLDIGGLHGVMFGQIDFSAGTVTTGKDGGATTTQSFEELLGHNITEGTHTMSIYYMERGSSQSNCAIYFNIAPRYQLQLAKEDIFDMERLEGAEFTLYTCEACANLKCTEHAQPQLAQLWDSREAHNQDMQDDHVDDAKSTFRVVNGTAYCWGISAGKTYYIKETKPPDGYPKTDDLIRITLNNRGTASIETTTLYGANGIPSEGFGVISQNVSDTLQMVRLVITNQKDEDTTEVRVEKIWAEGSENLPNSITVYLTADGVQVGRTAKLYEGNGWSYTWEGLPKYKEDGIDEEIVYVVEEVLVANYITTHGPTEQVENYVDWVRTDQMSDSRYYLLVHNDQALTYNGAFGWMDPTAAQADTARQAQWYVTTDHDGFHLKNGLGYTLTFDPETRQIYGVDDDSVRLNQVVYYLNSRLVFHSYDAYYQLGANGTTVSEDGLAFTLYRKEVLTGFLTSITNVPVDEESQTHVEVNKVWADGNDLHSGESVTINLYADGKDTGRDLILNAANNWEGGFYDLPYFREDGVTPVVYTVVEANVKDYTPDYSDPEALDGLPITLWRNATTLEAGQIYQFSNGGFSLAVNQEDNSVTALPKDLEDPYQQWQAVSYNGTIILKNVGSGLYLDQNNTTISAVSRSRDAVALTIDQDGHVRMGDWFLEVGNGYAIATRNSANISQQQVTRRQETISKPGVGYTVTNTKYYTLPETGGPGTQIFTLGGSMFLLGAALMYISAFGRKRGRRNKC